MVPGAVTYAIRFVSDMDEAIRLHEQQLRMKLRYRTGEWSEFDTGSTTLAPHIASEGNRAGSTQVGLRVASVDALCEEATRHGCTVIAPPADRHGMRSARLRDADGAVISVSSVGSGCATASGQSTHALARLAAPLAGLSEPPGASS